jgi:DNA-binding NarL/FixJ family response regulator
MPLVPIRIVLLDDEPLLRTTVRLLLATTPAVQLVEETANLPELPGLLATIKPHILLLGGQRDTHK